MRECFIKAKLLFVLTKTGAISLRSLDSFDYGLLEIMQTTFASSEHRVLTRHNRVCVVDDNSRATHTHIQFKSCLHKN